MAEIRIGERRIGPGHPVFVIAEAGVNHNGEVALAHRLVEAAKDAGADCVKFQTFKAERVAQVDAPKARYQLATTDPAETQIAMLRKLELADEALPGLIEACRAQGITFMSTPYNVEDAALLDRLATPAFKLASIHAAEPGFLRQVARHGRPMIVSTGMATMAEVEAAVGALRGAGNEAFALLQCTTNYPSRAEDANLKAMVTMREAFGAVVGYSDHTRTDSAVIASVALGAAIVERHFTLDPAMPGPDHASSLDPARFRRMVERVRETEAALGTGRKEPCAAETVNARNMRRSIVARRAIAKGAVLAEDDLTYKRPASGIAPARIDDVIGRRAAAAIAEGTPIAWEMLLGRDG